MTVAGKLRQLGNMPRLVPRAEEAYLVGLQSVRMNFAGLPLGHAEQTLHTPKSCRTSADGAGRLILRLGPEIVEQAYSGTVDAARLRTISRQGWDSWPIEVMPRCPRPFRELFTAR